MIMIQTISLYQPPKLVLDSRLSAHTTQSTPGQLLADQAPELSMEVSAAMGATDSVKDALERPDKALGMPPDPTSLQSLVIPDEWKTTGGTDPKPLLIHDSESDSV
ncbi:hypothetical protein LSH36_363g00000 [Paralvinella palmiformis]|uniref:Uncharacterized protein n=1 Tax=Paralvinella palmiformis TaxID=53620 RepID=A0AAD9JED8_9ANNE|nr:hypothetical protein LSH36_363g00000 [Paralvinella palmiformis]